MLGHALKYKNIKLDDYIIIDIRDLEDYKMEHIINAIWVRDIQRIGYIAKEHPDKKILLYCYHGNTARIYTETLLCEGIKNVFFLKENIEEFQELQIPMQK